MYTRKTSQPMTFGLALLTGGGLIVMMLALAIGVVQGAAANSATIGLVFVLGLALFLGGAGGWVAVTKPHENFDDLTTPHFTGHHHDDHHADEHDDTHEPAHP